MGIAERPEAISLAHRGLAGAAWRTLDSARRKHLLSCAVAATEALHWACALDEQLRDEEPGYESRRDQDQEGRVLPGLRHVRDRAMHQVIIGTAEDNRSFFKPRSGVLHIASSAPIGLRQRHFRKQTSDTVGQLGKRPMRNTLLNAELGSLYSLLYGSSRVS